MVTNHKYTPQMKLRTGLIAGESVESCQRNLEYWRNQLALKCSKKPGGGYTGYAPWSETEMQPWQAGTV